MLKNYLLAALRTLARNKAVTFLNILGLVIGIAASLLILQYVLFERSYDAFHERGDRIYRIRTESYVQNGVDDLPADGATAAGPAIAGLFPEVEDYVRITLAFRGIYSRGGNVFREENVLAASPSFFRVFSFRLLKGDGGTVLTEPNTMVITASVARKY
ncbi:MAG: ABC transporter permease, partial [Candidatus Aminicenantes bacterium]|nr:ABC transporter permease [Candidatus Aminicenantes bacterium]